MFNRYISDNFLLFTSLCRVDSDALLPKKYIHPLMEQHTLCWQSMVDLFFVTIIASLDLIELH